MATINNKEMIKDLIKNKGFFEDDPRVHRIVEYTNAYGNITWGVTWERDRDRDKYLEASQFVRNPRTIFCPKENISEEIN